MNHETINLSEKLVIGFLRNGNFFELMSNRRGSIIFSRKIGEIDYVKQ